MKEFGLLKLIEDNIHYENLKENLLSKDNNCGFILVSLIETIWFFENDINKILKESEIISKINFLYTAVAFDNIYEHMWSLFQILNFKEHICFGNIISHSFLDEKGEKVKINFLNKRDLIIFLDLNNDNKSMNKEFDHEKCNCIFIYKSIRNKLVHINSIKNKITNTYNSIKNFNKENWFTFWPNLIHHNERNQKTFRIEKTFFLNCILFLQEWCSNNLEEIFKIFNENELIKKNIFKKTDLNDFWNRIIKEDKDFYKKYWEIEDLIKIYDISNNESAKKFIVCIYDIKRLINMYCNNNYNLIAILENVQLDLFKLKHDFIDKNKVKDIDVDSTNYLAEKIGSISMSDKEFQEIWAPSLSKKINKLAIVINKNNANLSLLQQLFSIVLQKYNWEKYNSFLEKYLNYLINSNKSKLLIDFDLELDINNFKKQINFN